MVVADGHPYARVHRSGVEAFLQPHEAHTGLAVSGEDRSLDGGSTPPPREQREVEVHHRHRGQHMRLHELAEGNDHTEIHVEIEHVVDSAGDRKAQLQSRDLDRAGLESATTRSPLVGPGDDQRDLETGRDERS